MTDALDRRNSVTQQDYISATPDGGGPWVFQVIDPGGMRSPAPELPHASLATWGADHILANTLALEDMWAGAINQAATRVAVRGFEINDSDDSARRTRKAQDLIMNFDGAAEYRSGVNKTAQDFLTCRNGCFIEIERETDDPRSRPRALWHLDALRCQRTGHQEYPVLYSDLMGRYHALRRDQVIFFADMPSPRASLYGVGMPAAERAFKTIVKLAAIETYFREKITGARALKLVFISGVSKKKIEDIARTSEAEQERRGWSVYKGAVIAPTDTDQPISIAEVDLAGVADGFDVDSERRDAYLRYANIIGIPVQDIQPLSGQGLGTGTQTIVLAEGAEGRGLAYFTSTLEDRINWLLMPKTTTFTIVTSDWRNRKAQAEVQRAEADLIMSMRGSAQQPGIITDQQALNMVVDAGIVPREFLPEDLTPGATVTDSGEQSKLAEGQAVESALPAPAPVSVPTLKADDALDALIDAELEAALTWAREVSAT